jgi:hypothetical protein
MIISHKHKFIFIKPHKTAGTSVELLLSRICGINDIITPFGFDPDPKVRIKNNARSPQNYYIKKPFKNWQIKEVYYFLFKNIKINNNYWEHQPADEIRMNIGDDIWNSYKKISIVRNPWDRALSWFKWFEFRNNPRIRGENFEHYLLNHYSSAWPFYTINHGLYDIDYMIRFENLQEDLTSLLKQLDIDFPYELPKTKNNIRKKRDYKDFYIKSNMIEIVNEKALNIIHKFNYKY